MNIQTVFKLNQLNRDFYQTIAADFSDSRQYYWQGWDQLIPYFNQLKHKNQQLTVLDLGCGNGRFGKFLIEKVSTNVKYVGIDNSKKLLNIAQEKLSNFTKNVQFQELDLIDSIESNKLIANLNDSSPDVITLFGVLHHIPSSKLRIQLIKQLTSLLNPEGLLIFTVWKFTSDEKLTKKIANPAVVDLEKKDLEKNDYILDWKRGIFAYRYCHLTDETEVNNIIEKANLKVISQIAADGKSQNLNHYYVCKKK